MPTSYPVPQHRALEELLAGLVPSDVRVKVAGIEDPERDTPGVFAEYVTDDDSLVVCCFASHALVNAVGGALLDVEPNVAQESTAKSTVHDGCLDGFREAVNVLAAALNSEFTPHLKLRGVRSLPAEVTDELKALWRRPRARRSFFVSVKEYGEGALIVYAV